MDSIESILNQYKQAAFLHGQATLTGDYKKGNRHHDVIIGCYIKLRTTGIEAIEQLATLLDDEDDSVVTWAATHLLPYHEKRSIEVLTGISTKPGIIAFAAQMVLSEWRKGALTLDYPQYKKK
jgi:succinate dehydrogenase flavin-adding protein (antitoxin of CptAB toxin-antitoxin module)